MTTSPKVKRLRGKMSDVPEKFRLFKILSEKKVPYSDMARIVNRAVSTLYVWKIFDTYEDYQAYGREKNALNQARLESEKAEPETHTQVTIEDLPTDSVPNPTPQETTDAMSMYKLLKEIAKYSKALYELEVKKYTERKEFFESREKAKAEYFEKYGHFPQARPNYRRDQ